MSSAALNALNFTLILSLFPLLRSDIGYEGYKAHQKGPSPIEAANFSETTRVGMLVAKRAVFQSIASMYVHASPLLGVRAGIRTCLLRESPLVFN